MEYTQWDLYIIFEANNDSLNPCCNGIYSMSLSSGIPDK